MIRHHLGESTLGHGFGLITRVSLSDIKSYQAQNEERGKQICINYIISKKYCRM